MDDGLAATRARSGALRRDGGGHAGGPRRAARLDAGDPPDALGALGLPRPRGRRADGTARPAHPASLDDQRRASGSRLPASRSQDVPSSPATGHRAQSTSSRPSTTPSAACDPARRARARRCCGARCCDETGRGVPGRRSPCSRACTATAPRRDGAWVLVLPDDLAWVAPVGEASQVDVAVTLTPTAPGRRRRCCRTPAEAAPGPATASS